MMLFSMLSAAQGGKSIVYLSRHFGLSNRQMTNVIRHYLPILMRGIQKNFAQQGGLASLLKTLDADNYGSYYDDPNIYNNPEVRNKGLNIMERALGDEALQRKIMHRVYLSTGIDPDTLLLILPYVTTLALSTLYRKAHTQLNPAAMPTQLPYHGQNVSAQPQMQMPPQMHMQAQMQPQQQYYQTAMHHQQQPAQQFPIQQQQMQQPQMQHQHQHQQQQMNPYPQDMMHQQQQVHHDFQNMQQQHSPMPVSNLNNGMHQEQPQAQNVAFQPQEERQERLPNIILQAQEAHAQKQRKMNKKGRLSRMLKAPFQLAQGQSAQQQGQQMQPSQYNVPQHGGQNRKYVSLQERLSTQLPWYEQTG